MTYFDDNDWTARIAYLPDIFDQLYNVHLKPQGKETNIFQFQNGIHAFNFKRKTADLAQTSKPGNVAVFEKLCSVVDQSESGINQLLEDEVSQPLEAPIEEMQRYFPEFNSIETQQLL